MYHFTYEICLDSQKTKNKVELHIIKIIQKQGYLLPLLHTLTSLNLPKKDIV